jgi:hypothetical protein
MNALAATYLRVGYDETGQLRTEEFSVEIQPRDDVRRLREHLATPEGRNEALRKTLTSITRTLFASDNPGPIVHAYLLEVWAENRRISAKIELLRKAEEHAKPGERIIARCGGCGASFTSEDAFSRHSAFCHFVPSNATPRDVTR